MGRYVEKNNESRQSVQPVSPLRFQTCNARVQYSTVSHNFTVYLIFQYQDTGLVFHQIRGYQETSVGMDKEGGVGLRKVLNQNGA